MSKSPSNKLAMSDPRFQPRSFTSEPEGFGKASTLPWRSDGDPVLIAAAQLQHRVAVLIRSGAKRKHRSIGAYAEAIGQTPDRLAKVLRGEAVMRLEDIAAARLHLDLNIEVET